MPEVQVALLGRFDVVVDGSVSQASRLTRRQASALIKLLALTPSHQLHRERVLDLIWPDDTVDEALPKLHKAAHFARRACEHEDAVVLRGDLVRLFPDSVLTVDALVFEQLAHHALETHDLAAARDALALYGGELLPEDRFEDWADLTRESLAQLHRELLRLDARWRELIELDPADEGAHVELMRQALADGDRHAAIRQFERLDRALRQELGVAPGPEALRLRERAIAEQAVAPRRTPLGGGSRPLGRDAELDAIEQLLDDAATGVERTVFVSGPAGMGKSTILAAWRAAAERRGVLVASGTAAPIEGSWPYAPVVEAISGLARRHPSLLSELPEPAREELDHVLAGAQAEWSGKTGHQRFFVASAALFRAAAARGGLLITIDDVHDADDASLRLLHYLSRGLLENRIVLALGLRPAPHSETLTELHQSMVARHGALDFELAPLTTEQVGQLVTRQIPDAGAELIEQVAGLSGGIPFVAGELARRAAEEPAWVSHVDLNAIGGIPPATRETLQRVAVLGLSFDTDDFLASTDLEEHAAFGQLDTALASGAIERTEAGYQFRHRLVRDALLADVPPHRRRLIHRDVAERLIAANASPAQIGHHLIEAGETVRAVPHLLRAAESEAAIGAYRDALEILERVRATASGENRARLLRVRADLLTAVGDQGAVAAYREAIDAATGDTSLLRARLARAAIIAGDLQTAQAVLNGVDASETPDAGEVLLVQGQLAYFTGDYETAQRIAEQARVQVLGGDKNWQALDLMSLQGLLAHQRGEWFDRMRVELRNASVAPDIANAIFDGYLCPAEYLLYGSTPYADVIELARTMQATAEKSGALRAVAFARALVGESALLSGDLELASTELTEAVELHHVLGSGAGEAHCLQRLAEVRLAQGDPESARRLLDQALPLARWSMIAMHLIQRIYGTMIAAAPDVATARAIVDRAEATMGTDDGCQFCGIMLALPAMVACAHSGDLERANHYAAVARRSSQLWDGTSWQAAFDEALAHVTIAEGGDAVPYLDGAIVGFERAGQPVDVARATALRLELTR